MTSTVFRQDQWKHVPCLYTINDSSYLAKLGEKNPNKHIVLLCLIQERGLTCVHKRAVFTGNSPGFAQGAAAGGLGNTHSDLIAAEGATVISTSFNVQVTVARSCIYSERT